MLALDPPLGAGDGATIGGIVATADSGPLRHRYGGVRDLVVGITVVLSDGTVAKSGGKVIKNVAGYDLAKLFAGSFGTLGLIASVSRAAAPAADADRDASRRAADDPDELAARGARRSPRCRSRPTASTSPGRGGARRGCSCASAAPRPRAGRARPSAPSARLETCVEDDDELWAAQRARQRGRRRRPARSSGRPTDLPRRAARGRAGGATVGLARRARACPGSRSARRRPRRRAPRSARGAAPRARARCSTAPRRGRATRGRARRPALGRDGARSRSASTRRGSSARAPSWEESELATAWDEHPPARARPDQATACTAASACRRARATRSSRTRWTRRAGASC